MKNFWKAVALFYKFLLKAKQNIMISLLVLILLINLIFSFVFVFKLNKLNTEIELNRLNFSQALNRVYSQVYLLNNKIK